MVALAATDRHRSADKRKNMSDEINESAKAVQEVAKTTGQAIKTIEKIGSFFSLIMHESIDTTCDMLADTLKFKRWERQIRLIEKSEKIIKQKNLSDRLRPISPKLALPIFHNASLETDESLHDILANLIVTAFGLGWGIGWSDGVGPS